ncbi:unnamed protein product [Sphagnum jensenii]|uniref:Tr-type G domain-containing protein n=1 Tax=Sphagnum jensenii TaxID=128206 RepID=A0ABP0WJJ0_9BRYO
MMPRAPALARWMARSFPVAPARGLSFLAAIGRRRFSMAAALPPEVVDNPSAVDNKVVSPSSIRNVAIIAHVDYGKTTLLDCILRQCGANVPRERAMDSIALECERGITIDSKYTSITWKGMELNVVDTPGHADFGGEVERVLGMVEGAVLVVDAGEVTEQRCSEVETLVFDLFANLGASVEQLEFPVLYASAKEGLVSQAYTKCTEEVSMMERDVYLGRILTGRIVSGVVRVGDRGHGLHCTEGNSTPFDECKVTEALPAAAMDPPTISMTFSINDSPLAGREGHQLTGPKIGERLMAEAESNLSIGVLPTAGQDTYEVQGCGDLQLSKYKVECCESCVIQDPGCYAVLSLIVNTCRAGILLENMWYKEENGKKLEPIEEVIIEVNDDHAGLIIEALSHHRAEFLEMGPCPEAVGLTRLSFTCPSRLRAPSFSQYAFSLFFPLSICLASPFPPLIQTVNPVCSKELNNIRAAGKDENVRLTPPRMIFLEEAIGYVAGDELIEGMGLQAQCLLIFRIQKVQKWEKVPTVGTFPTADNALVAPFRLEIALDHTLLACLSKMPMVTETAPDHHATIFCLRI